MEFTLHKIIDAQTELGPRGSVKITTANRAAVRRWLTGHGVTSKTARSLPLSELDHAYNIGATFYDDVFIPATEEQPKQEQPKQEQPKQEQPKQEQPKEQATMTNNNDKAAQIAAVLAGIMGDDKSPVDRDQVKEIIEELAPDLIAKHSKRLVIEAADVPKITIDNAHPILSDVVTCLANGVKVWLAGPAGSGKTTLAAQAAEALGVEFYSTGAVSSDFRLVGFMNAQGECVRTVFREAFEFGGVFLLDEADASNPMALVALNQAIENGEYAFPDGMVKRHPDFKVIVAANTYGSGPTAAYVGRAKIDAATVDRFFFMAVDYDPSIEALLSGGNEDWLKKVQKARDVLAKNGVNHIISPRAVRDGAKLIKAGLDVAVVARGTIRKGLDNNSWTKVANAISVAA